MKADTLYLGAGLHVGIIREGDGIVWRDTVHCGSQMQALQRAQKRRSRSEAVERLRGKAPWEDDTSVR